MSSRTTRPRSRKPLRTSTSRSRPSSMKTGAAPEQVDTDGNGAAPRLADGVELIGKYEGSGFKDPPYLARRADGQVVQLPELLFLVLEQVDGRTGYDEIAERVSEAFGRGLE